MPKSRSDKEFKQRSFEHIKTVALKMAADGKSVDEIKSFLLGNECDSDEFDEIMLVVYSTIYPHGQ